MARLTLLRAVQLLIEPTPTLFEAVPALCVITFVGGIILRGQARKLTVNE